MTINGDPKSNSFISSDFVYYSIIIIISLLLVLYLIKRFLLGGKSEFHSKDYWDSRYSIFSQKFDWYCEFDKISKDFKINDLLLEYYPKKSKTRILELGCGNSSLALELFNMGYTKITSIDFSSVVIKHMQTKYKDTCIECMIKVI